jgi:glycosyltransferase involved in cell wall biosynthesis
MSIDVVLANYNHAEFISNAIRALNNQTLKPHRIIVIDDHSSDNSKSILYSELKKYSNILLISNKFNLGAVKSYNLGLASVTSDYVYFAAADDETFPLLFQKSIKMLEMYPEAAFSCAEAIMIDRESGSTKYRPLVRPRQKSIFLIPREVTKEFKHNDNWIQTGTCVYKTKLIRNVGGFNDSLGAFSDSIIAKQLSMTHGCIFIRYYGVKWNISNLGFSRNSMRNLSEFKEIKNHLQTYVSSRKAFPSWYWSVYSSRLDSMFYRNLLKGSPTDIEEINKHYLKQIFYIYRASNSFGKELINMFFQLFIFLRFHPFSIFKLLKSTIFRVLEKYINKKLEN